MTSSHVVIGTRKWATHYDPMGDGAAGVLYGFTKPDPSHARTQVFMWSTPRQEIEVLFEQAELDLIDNPLAYPSRHVVDHD